MCGISKAMPTFSRTPDLTELSIAMPDYDQRPKMPFEGTAAGRIAAALILYGGALGVNMTGENIPRSMA